MRLYACREFIEAPRSMTADKESRGVVRSRALLSGSMIKLAKCMCLEVCCARKFLWLEGNSSDGCLELIGTTSIGYGTCFEIFWLRSPRFNHRLVRAAG